MSEVQSAQSLPPAPSSQRIRAALLILGAGVLALVVLNATRAQVGIRDVPERSWPVAVKIAKIENKIPELKVFGTIVAAREVALRPRVSGEIIEINPNFKEGGVITKGDLLVRIDPADYERAVAESKARLAESEAVLVQIETQIAQEKRLADYTAEELEITRRDYARSQSLSDAGDISQKVLDDKRLLVLRQEGSVENRASALKVQQARLAQQQAGHAQRELALNRAQRDLEDTVLKAPFDGWAGNIAAGVGRSVGLQDRLAVLTEADALEARFIFPDSMFGALLAGGAAVGGRPVRIVWRTGASAHEFDGQIARVGARISAAAGGVEIYAALAEDVLYGALRPGAFVEIYAPGPNYRQVYVVPEEALYEGGGAPFLYIMLQDGRLARRDVVVAGRHGSEVFIRHGLEAGDAILITRFPEAGPGVRVHLAEIAGTVE